MPISYRILRGKYRDYKRRADLWRRRRANPPPEPYRSMLGMTLYKWYLRHQRDIVIDSCSWMGVRTQKNPLDAWIYQEIIWEQKPDVVLEIGSRDGGSALYFSHLLDAIGNGVVVSVDIDRSTFAAKHERIVLVTGDSSSPEVVEEVMKHCAGKKTLVIHDGDHSCGKVLADLRAYSGLVRPGGYLIVEDGVMDLFTPGDGLGWDEAGPMKAVERFIAENPDFQPDPARERYLITYNPRGYLKRIR